MSRYLHFEENNIHLAVRITDDGRVQVLHFQPRPFDESRMPDETAYCPGPVEIAVTGCPTGYLQQHGQKHLSTGQAARLRYVSHTDTVTPQGRLFSITQEADGLRITSHLLFCAGCPVVRAWTDAENTSDAPIGLEYLSTLVIPGLAVSDETPWDRKSLVGMAHNAWLAESQWQIRPIADFGVCADSLPSTKPVRCSNTGSWSSSCFLPMGFFRNTETGCAYLWQIEHNGSWSWEINDAPHSLTLQLSGPSEDLSHWWKNLRPGEVFTTVPAAVSMVCGDFEASCAALTRYRRLFRRSNRDNEHLPVIFNDYMNCLSGDATTEKLLPLIDAAAEAGCDYFVVDCGWYADGFWWDSVGEWMPSKKRFPNGIEEVMRYIRKKGMVPGLWLEIEAMGIHCPLADKLPDDWFFCRHGKRIAERCRYHLDFSNPAVRDYASGVVRRLTEDYGVGYIKMDYNLEIGIGTENDHTDSCGDGLLAHNRALLAWYDSLFEKYPDLVIENCASGGLRMDYAMLSRCSIQSSSDQTDYRRNAVIVSGAAAAVCPEQCAVWSYPLHDADRDQTAFNMVNALLLRIHQSGHLAELSPEAFALVREGIAVYKDIRADIPQSVPAWPLGLPDLQKPYLAFALDGKDKRYLAVWRREGESDFCRIPLPASIRYRSCTQLYPSYLDNTFRFDREQQTLTVTLPRRNTAVLLCLAKA